MLLTGTSMSAAQGRGRACRTSGDRGAARALLLGQDTDGHPGKVPPPPPRPGDTSCRVMEAQEHLPAILIPPSRAGQAAPMSPSQPHSNASAVVPSTPLSPQQCPSSPAVSPTPLPAAPWPCRCLFPPGLAIPLPSRGGGREGCRPPLGLSSPVSPGSVPPTVSGGSVGSCQLG